MNWEHTRLLAWALLHVIVQAAVLVSKGLGHSDWLVLQYPQSDCLASIEDSRDD